MYKYIPNHARGTTAHSSHDLVWALPITADSYTKGIVRHRIYTHPLSVLKAYATWLRRTEREAAVARLPTELWVMIEGFLFEGADDAGERATREYTWNRRERDRARKLRARQRAQNAKAGADAPGAGEDEEGQSTAILEESQVCTSDESAGGDEEHCESEAYSNKMDERSAFFAVAAQKFCWELKRSDWNPRKGSRSYNYAHLQDVFGLGLVVTTSQVYWQRHGKITHVYLCLPCIRHPVRDPVKVERCDSPRLKNERMRIGWHSDSEITLQSKKLETPNPRIHSSDWEPCWKSEVTEVDAEYLQMTREKIEKINRAVRELGLVLDDEPMRQPDRYSVCRLASEFRATGEDEVDRENFSWLKHMKPGDEVFDFRAKPWPTIGNEAGNGDANEQTQRPFYVPKLLSILQGSLNEHLCSCPRCEPLRRYMEEGSETSEPWIEN